jgi:ABC-type transporter Mla subunit MlaD
LTVEHGSIAGTVRGVEQDLRKLLDELDAAIDRSREGDDDHTELSRLVEAVSRRLDETPDEDDQNALLESMERGVARFQGEHPTLADALRRAIDVLSAAGI